MFAAFFLSPAQSFLCLYFGPSRDWVPGCVPGGVCGGFSAVAECLSWKSLHEKGRGSLWGHSHVPGSEAKLIQIYSWKNLFA